MRNNRKCGRKYPYAASASASSAFRSLFPSGLQLHIIYIIGNSLPFPNALHQPSQYAASACAACCDGHRSALAFLHPWFRVFLAAVSFCPRSLFHLCSLPGEISIPRLRMAVQSLLMYIQRLRMCIQRLQTEILASSFRNFGIASLVPYNIIRTLGELPNFEVMTWQPCHLQRSAMNCVQITLYNAKVKQNFQCTRTFLKQNTDNVLKRS